MIYDYFGRTFYRSLQTQLFFQKYGVQIHRIKHYTLRPLQSMPTFSNFDVNCPRIAKKCTSICSTLVLPTNNLQSILEQTCLDHEVFTKIPPAKYILRRKNWQSFVPVAQHKIIDNPNVVVFAPCSDAWLMVLVEEVVNQLRYRCRLKSETNFVLTCYYSGFDNNLLLLMCDDFGIIKSETICAHLMNMNIQLQGKISCHFVPVNLIQ